MVGNITTLFLLHTILLPGLLSSQIGIGATPKATLHIEPSSISSPTGKDGILIPRVSEFPTAQAKGQMIFLQENGILPDGFYYFDGIDWSSFIINSFDQAYLVAPYQHPQRTTFKIFRLIFHRNQIAKK